MPTLTLSPLHLRLIRQALLADIAEIDLASWDAVSGEEEARYAARLAARYEALAHIEAALPAAAAAETSESAAFSR